MGKSTEGIAIWAVPKSAPPQASMEVHLNYWRLAGHKAAKKETNRLDLLEVGLWLEQPLDCDWVSLFLPFSCNRADVSDLCQKFKELSLSQAIFNEAFKSVANGRNNRWYDPIRESGDVFCRVYAFDALDGSISDRELGLTPLENGTLVRINVSTMDFSDLPSQTPVYLRLRVRLALSSTITPFVDVIRPDDHFLQSGYDEVEVVNFRVNEARTLPKGVEKAMREETNTRGSMPISKLAFLTAVPVVSGISVSHPLLHKARLLESDIWSDYVDGVPAGAMMVYHWRKDAPEPSAKARTARSGDRPITAASASRLSNDFSALVKLQTRKSGLKIVLTYVTIAFILGFFGNLSASALDKWTGMSASIPPIKWEDLWRLFEPKKSEADSE